MKNFSKLIVATLLIISHVTQPIKVTYTEGSQNTVDILFAQNEDGVDNLIPEVEKYLSLTVSKTPSVVLVQALLATTVGALFGYTVGYYAAGKVYPPKPENSGNALVDLGSVEFSK